MTEYHIKLDKNSRKEIVKEDVEKIKKAIEQKGSNEIFFYEEYIKANDIVTRIKNSEEENSFLLKNNIITFTGNRGTGKTSAMCSFGEYLKGKPNFKVLEMIDPSHFSQNKSILLNVITLLFKSVKDHLKNNKEHQPPTTDLVRQFETVFKAVKKMDEPIPQESSLEYLDQLSDSLDLNKKIGTLIKDSLKFFDNGFEYLVLMIDDLDMNVSYAPLMLEQIRKFLIQKKLILLISTNLDQLQFEMKEHYSEFFQKTYNPNSPTSAVEIDVEDMATKYLLKLFSPQQRIHIGNSAEKLINTKITITDEKEEIVKDKDLQKAILTLIWKKTRLLFVPENGSLHPIIPTNLRALHQLIHALLDMDSIEKKKEDDQTQIEKEKKEEESNLNKMFKSTGEYEIIKKNFLKFKDYIHSIWIPSNVTFEEQKVFDNIPKEIGRINKHLMQSINVIGTKYKKQLLVKEIETKDMLIEDKKLDRDFYTFVGFNDPNFSMANRMSDMYNFPSNNSMGDVLLLVDKYKTYFEAENNNHFIEAVKIYYALLLFEIMFLDDPIPNENYNNQDELPVKITNIQKLIGGTLYYPHYFPIMKGNEHESIILAIKKTFTEIKKYIASPDFKKIDDSKTMTAIKDRLDQIVNYHSEIKVEDCYKEKILNGITNLVLNPVAELIEKYIKEETDAQTEKDKYQEILCYINADEQFENEEDTSKKIEILKISEPYSKLDSNTKKEIEEKLASIKPYSDISTELNSIFTDYFKTSQEKENDARTKKEAYTRINNHVKGDDFKKLNDVSEQKKSIKDLKLSLSEDEIDASIPPKTPTEFLEKYESRDCFKKYLRDDGVLPHVFYHECPINKIKDGKSIPNEIDTFFILYYGDKRPERYYSTHIYDTVKRPDSEILRFDILSLLVNILNHSHTLCRCYNTEIEKIKEDKKKNNPTASFSEDDFKNETWFSDITAKKTWLCNIDGKRIANILLPVYSVDLMLIYLKSPINYNKIFPNTFFTENTENIKNRLEEAEDKMRKISEIKTYYEHLRNITIEKLDEIDDNNTGQKISTLYGAIYDEGAKLFLTEKS